MISQFYENLINLNTVILCRDKFKMKMKEGGRVPPKYPIRIAYLVLYN